LKVEVLTTIKVHDRETRHEYSYNPTAEYTDKFFIRNDTIPISSYIANRRLFIIFWFEKPQRAQRTQRKVAPLCALCG
jgi:hypothetical protein